MSGWIVVVTKPNCENIAAVNLERQGYKHYLPRFRHPRPNKTFLIKPLFPRYLFAFVDKFWYSIRGTRGVSHALFGEAGPCYVPSSAIDSLKLREDKDGYYVLFNSMQERFQKGDSVVVTEGPLVGHPLVYDGMTARERVRVLASLLGGQVPVILDEKILAAA